MDSIRRVSVFGFLAIKVRVRGVGPLAFFVPEKDWNSCLSRGKEIAWLELVTLPLCRKKSRYSKRKGAECLFEMRVHKNGSRRLVCTKCKLQRKRHSIYIFMFVRKEHQKIAISHSVTGSSEF